VSGGARTQAQESLVYIVPFEPLSELRCSLLFDAVIHLGDISTLHPRSGDLLKNSEAHMIGHCLPINMTLNYLPLRIYPRPAVFRVTCSRGAAELTL
jgi:hypothetical protein